MFDDGPEYRARYARYVLVAQPVTDLLQDRKALRSALHHPQRDPRCRPEAPSPKRCKALRLLLRARRRLLRGDLLLRLPHRAHSRQHTPRHGGACEDGAGGALAHVLVLPGAIIRKLLLHRFVAQPAPSHEL